jgi:Ca-activated chloride channel family protein
MSDRWLRALGLSLLFGCTPVGPPTTPEGIEPVDVIPAGELQEPSELDVRPGCRRGAPGQEPTIVEPGAELGQGRLTVQRGDQRLALPLQRVDVDTYVTGSVAETTVTQVFHNPFKEPIEAIYAFPLPADGAVDDFTLRAGTLVVRGQIRERGEAKKIYEAAKTAGKVAALLEQERPNIFTQSVANIPPGQAIEVEIHVVHEVRQNRGTFELALPTAIGPRFIPGTPLAGPPSGNGLALDTTTVPDASRITPADPAPCADLDIHVTILGGYPPELVRAKHHRIRLDKRDMRAEVHLAEGPMVPNRDFVLSWRTAGPEPRAAMLAQREAAGGYFTLVVQPPLAASDDMVRPRELIFLVDTSGSMGGWPIQAVKRVIGDALTQMRPDDVFQIVDFNDEASALGAGLLAADDAGRKLGQDYIADRTARGGTMMNGGIQLALGLPRDPERVRYILLLTDGFIGNELEIFRSVEAGLGDSRLLSFGIGSSTNRYLLDGAARVGRGAVTYVEHAEDADAAAASFYARIARPVLTDIQIDWGDLAVQDVVPARIPDVFAGEPVVVHGRFTGTPSGKAKLRGKLGRTPVEIGLRLDFADGQDHTGIESMWARRTIDDIQGYPTNTRQFGGDPNAVRAKVIELSLKHHVLSQFTAFVAVAEQSDGKPVTAPILADTDADGIDDSNDRCTTEPENLNGFMDDDGCPDALPMKLAMYTGTIKGIFFDLRAATIKPTSRPVLDRAVTMLTEYSTIRVEITGHTEPGEPRDFGRRRAESVRDYLVRHGIDPKRIEVRNAGPDEPIDTNKTRAGRARNRRIEFTILVQ